jgi:hypothetical protein
LPFIVPGNLGRLEPRRELITVSEQLVTPLQQDGAAQAVAQPLADLREVGVAEHERRLLPEGAAAGPVILVTAERPDEKGRGRRLMAMLPVVSGAEAVKAFQRWPPPSSRR